MLLNLEEGGLSRIQATYVHANLSFQAQNILIINNFSMANFSLDIASELMLVFAISDG